MLQVLMACWMPLNYQANLWKTGAGAEALAFISGHYETGEPLPQAMLDNMLKTKIISQQCLYYAN